MENNKKPEPKQTVSSTLIHQSEKTWDESFAIAMGNVANPAEQWKYTFLDGVTYLVKNADELIEKLYLNTWFIDRSKTTVQDYMVDFAKRVYMVYGVWLNHNTASHFVADLITYGIVKVEKTIVS